MDHNKIAKWGLRGLAALALGIIGAAVCVKAKDNIQYNHRLDNPDIIMEYQVRGGDKLWNIGEEKGYCPYWMDIRDWVLEAAEMNNRKHNPDSLVPGENLKLPAWYTDK